MSLRRVLEYETFSISSCRSSLALLSLPAPVLYVDIDEIYSQLACCMWSVALASCAQTEHVAAQLQLLLAEANAIADYLFIAVIASLITGQPFYPKLREFMTSAPCTALSLERVDAIKGWRALLGPTDVSTCSCQVQ
jgi:Nucleoside diphosphate kinase